MQSLLIIDDDPSLGEMLRGDYRPCDINVLTAQSATEGLALAARWHPDLVILNAVLPDQSGLTAFEQLHRDDPGIPMVFVASDGTSDTAIEAVKLGALDYLRKPIDLATIRGIVTQAINIRESMRQQPDEDVNKITEVTEADGEGGLVGRCEAMQQVYKAVGRVAPQNVNVLILGESGTGKELVARAIHRHSARSAAQFLAVNCAAIPEPLLESELFGHEKGSFTGADHKRLGKFEQGSGGTLFLDEVGDMTPLMQSKVLRVLQDQQFERVGGNQTIETDVRIIAATNRNLEQMLADGQFRADLYYRLNGFTINLPPLRERPEDVPLLVDHFLGQYRRELGKNVCQVPPGTMDLLLKYPWPGNIRELQSVLRQALLHATGPGLLPEFLPLQLGNGHRRPPPDPDDGQRQWVPLDVFVDQRLQAGSCELYAEALARMERFVLTRVLRYTRGNQSQAAKILGITRGSLRKKIRMQGITINPTVSIDEDPLAGEPDAPAELAVSSCG